MFFSLQTTWIRNSLLHALRNSAKVETRNVPNNFVYQHPTVQQLSDFVFSIVSGGSSKTSTLTGVDAMHAMLEKYSTEFPIHTPLMSHPEGRAVLLTGSTGGLGSNLLAQLVVHPDVTRVYLLNRKSQDGSSLKDRQRRALIDRGLPSDLLESGKAVLLEGDQGKINFDLPSDTYQMVSNVSLILNIAYRFCSCRTL